MQRVKTFNATGVAPNGVLYAGDLNAIQDAAAALADFAQTISVAALQIGDSTIQLLRYGAGEARLTAALRTDGIIRGLGGLYAGAYTTAQRDAIGAGFRPYGLIILNTNTNRLEVNLGTDPSPQWNGLGGGGSVASGILSGRPSPTALNANSWYFATDINGGTLYYSNGSAWTQVTEGLTAPIPLSRIGSDVPVVPIGATLGWPWSSGSIPAWALLPYGQAISRTVYAALYTIASATGLGVYGGGDGTTTFNLPDERGRVEVGKDDMGGVTAGRITAAITGVAGTSLGATFGAEGITLTTGQLPAHSHGVTGSPGITDPGHFHTYQVASGAQTGGGSSTNTPTVPANTSTATTGITVGAGSLGTSSVGSGSAVQNTQPSIIVNRVMRVV